MTAPTAAERVAAWTLRYHVPRSQVWEGSRGTQEGKVHLHPPGPVTLTAVTGRRTTITRTPGKSLCGRDAWYDREDDQGEELCPRCIALAERYAVPLPERGGRRTGGPA